MARLIVVPQYPTPMRYQEWWAWYLPRQYLQCFEEVLVLMPPLPDSAFEVPMGARFAPDKLAQAFEVEQVKMYMDLPLLPGDVLLLCDLSFPGTFACHLRQKRPARAFAVCHATAKNRYDIWASVRAVKYAREREEAKLFDAVFVGSNYHKDKLGWDNIVVSGMPFPPLAELLPERPLCAGRRAHEFVSVARPTRQKVNKKLERAFERRVGKKIEHPAATTWSEYYTFLMQSRYLIVTAREETFGYQVVDALLMGALPIAPYSCSYPELVPPTCLYEEGSVSSMVDAVRSVDCMRATQGLPKIGFTLSDHFFAITRSVMQ